MKKLFIYVLLAFGVFISNAQNREIRNDTIILGSKSIGLIKHDDHGDEKAYIQKHSETAYFKDRASLKQNKSWVKDFHNVIKRCRVDKFILDTLLLFNSNWVTKNGVKIGSYKHIGRYGRAKVVEIKIFYEDLYSESLDFIEYSAEEAFGEYALLLFKLDLSSLKTYRRKRAELEEQQRE